MNFLKELHARNATFHELYVAEMSELRKTSFICFISIRLSSTSFDSLLSFGCDDFDLFALEKKLFQQVIFISGDDISF